MFINKIYLKYVEHHTSNNFPSSNKNAMKANKAFGLVTKIFCETKRGAIDTGPKCQHQPGVSEGHRQHQHFWCGHKFEG